MLAGTWQTLAGRQARLSIRSAAGYQNLEEQESRLTKEPASNKIFSLTKPNYRATAVGLLLHDEGKFSSWMTPVEQYLPGI